MKKIFKLALAFLFLAAATTWQLQKENLAEIYFLDIGQGDAILLRVNGQNILVDGGPDNLLLYRLGEVLPWWDKKIDYLIISHFHDDHYMGFIELLNRYQVKNILVGAHRPEEEFLFSVWQQAVGQHQLEPKVVHAGDQFYLAPNIFWQILAADSQHEDFNDNSLLIKFTIGEIKLLLTGDLTSDKEKDLLKAKVDLSADILKVAHHGSKYSSALDFLQAVSPQLCVIQSETDNSFGHPHQETLERLEAIGCQILRNDSLGNIKVESDGLFWQLD